MFIRSTNISNLLGKCIKTSLTSQIVFFSCVARVISSLFPPLYSTCFHFILVVAFTSFCSPQMHTQRTHTAHTHSAHTRSTHTQQTQHAPLALFIIYARSTLGRPSGAPEMPPYLYAHTCVCACVRRHSFGHRAELGKGRGVDWGTTTTRDNKRPRLTLELRSYCHLLLPG